MPRPAEDEEDRPTERAVQWDLATALLLTTVIVIILYLTFELWIPHWGTQ